MYNPVAVSGACTGENKGDEHETPGKAMGQGSVLADRSPGWERDGGFFTIVLAGVIGNGDPRISCVLNVGTAVLVGLGRNRNAFAKNVLVLN